MMFRLNYHFALFFATRWWTTRMLFFCNRMEPLYEHRASRIHRVSTYNLDSTKCPEIGTRVLGPIFLAIVFAVFQGCNTESLHSRADGPIGGLRRIDHFAIHVSDLEASSMFYERVFGFQIVNKWSKVWMVGNDKIRIGLFQHTDASSVPDPENRLLIEHVALLTSENGFASALFTLDKLNIPHDPVEDSGIAKSVFIKDPDGHNIELTYYYKKKPSR